LQKQYFELKELDADQGKSGDLDGKSI